MILNTSTILSVIRDDVADTLRNTNEVSQLLSILATCDGLSVQYAKSLLSGISDTQLTTMIENCPITVDCSDAVDQDSSTFMVKIKSVAQGISSEIQCFDVADDGTLQLNDSILTLNGLNYNFDSLINYAGQALCNADLIQGALDAVKTVNPTTYFDAVVSKYNGALSGNTPGLASMLKSSLAQSDAKGSLALTLSQVYQNLNNPTPSGDGIGFVNEAYYVQGFCGELLVGTIFNTVSSLISVVTAAVAPVIAVCSGILSAIGNAISNTLINISDTQYSYDGTASDDLYAQGTCFKHMKLSQLPSSIGTRLAHSGVLKFGCANFVINLILTGDDVSMVVVPRFCCATSINSNQFMGGSVVTDHCYASSFTVGKYSGMCAMSQAKFSANADDFTVRLLLVQSLAMISMLIDSNVSHNPTATPYSPSFSTNMSLTELSKFIACGFFANNNLPEALTIVSWENIVNYVIPSMQKLFDNNAINWPLITPFLTTPFSVNNNMFFSEDYVDNTEVSVKPPKYSLGALMAQVAGIAVTAIAAAVITTTALSIKKKIRNSMHRRLVDIESLKYRYEATGSDDDWNAYFKATKRYNRIAGLTGYNKISLYNGSEIQPEKGESMISMSVLYYKITGQKI